MTDTGTSTVGDAMSEATSSLLPPIEDRAAYARIYKQREKITKIPTRRFWSSNIQAGARETPTEFKFDGQETNDGIIRR